MSFIYLSLPLNNLIIFHNEYVEWAMDILVYIDPTLPQQARCKDKF